MNWMRVAASIVVIGVVGLWLWGSGPEYVIPEGFEHYPSHISVTRSDDPSDLSMLKQKAYNLYEIREYKLAAPMLEKVFQEEGDDISLFYAGVAYMGYGNVDKAQEVWSEVDVSELGDEEVYHLEKLQKK